MSRIEARRVGHVEVVALTDGAEVIGSRMTEAFPDVPAEAHDEMRARHPDLYGAFDEWRLVVRAWLVRHPQGVLLMDTGVGPSTSAAMAWFPTPGRLHDALAEAGATADQIDTVVLSHVHDDHVGGTLDATGAPAFPRARYVLQRADLDAITAWATESEEERVVLETMIEPIRAAGQLDLVDGDVALTDAIGLRHTPGHTPGHQVLRIASDGARMVLSADTWNHPAQFGRPEWASATDAEPARATAARRALLADLLSHPGSVVAPAHLDAPFGRIVDGPDGRARFDAIAP